MKYKKKCKIKKKSLVQKRIIALFLLISLMVPSLFGCISMNDDNDSNTHDNDETNILVPTDPKELFEFKLNAEKNTFAMSYDKLFRNPANYADNNVYRLGGEVAYISKSSSYSEGLLRIYESDTLIYFCYDGMLEFLEGDIVILYGNFLPDLYEYSEGSKIYQTACLNVVYVPYYGDTFSGTTTIEDYEWDMICGTYVSDDNFIKLLPKEITFDSQKINGMSYRIIKIEHRYPSILSGKDSACEGINMTIEFSDRHNRKIVASFSFYYSGKVFYLCSEGPSVSVYNLDMASYYRDQAGIGYH